MRYEEIYRFTLTNNNLGVSEEVVIKDYDHELARALKDAYTIFFNRLLECDEFNTGKSFQYYVINNLLDGGEDAGWYLDIEGCEDYDPDLIDVDNCYYG